MKASNIYFIASMAAENALPVESGALIKKRDSLQREWDKAKREAADWSIPVPQEMIDAQKAIAADPLANAAMQIRVMGNQAAMHEYRDGQKSAE